MDAVSRKETLALIEFIRKSPSAFQAVDTVSAMLEADGYVRLQETEPWDLRTGGKYYVTRNGSSVLAFRLPAVPAAQPAFQLSASHSDSPAFKLKINAETGAAGAYCRLNTEVYGGAVLHTWLDRPLSLAGRLVLKTASGFATRSVNIDRDLLVIPNVAVHHNRELNNGFKYNAASDTFPLFAMGTETGRLNALLADAAEVDAGDIAASDLYLYNRTPGTLFGADEEFYGTPRIDDLQCAYGTLRGFLAGTETGNVPVYAMFDNEETGSGSKQGAASGFLYDTLGQIADAMGVSLSRMLAGSFMVSADNGHAKHPNHPEFSDPDNFPLLNGGVVIKGHASQRYTTDALSAAVFKDICDRAGAASQVYYNRSDLPSGGTLGGISNTRAAMNTLDIGMAQLAMHSCYETGGTADTAFLIRAMAGFYSTPIRCTADGQISVG